MIDLTPACKRTADVLMNVTDDQLNGRTPCEKLKLRDLVAHVGGLAPAFTAAARKEFGELTDTPPVEVAPLDEDWRAGGVDFPGEVGGIIALTEVVIHGWDVAAVTGQSYDIDGATAVAVLPHVTAIAAEGPVEGLFGPAVAIADDAPTLDRIVALSGRDPSRRA
jgi:uncharacterized protein (TIGR03083 family)